MSSDHGNSRAQCLRREPGGRRAAPPHDSDGVGNARRESSITGRDVSVTTSLDQPIVGN